MRSRCPGRARRPRLPRRGRIPGTASIDSSLLPRDCRHSRHGWVRGVRMHRSRDRTGRAKTPFESGALHRSVRAYLGISTVGSVPVAAPPRATTSIGRPRRVAALRHGPIVILADSRRRVSSSRREGACRFVRYCEHVDCHSGGTSEGAPAGWQVTEPTEVANRLALLPYLIWEPRRVRRMGCLRAAGSP